MKIIRNILIIAVALLLQSTLFGSVTIAGIRPDMAMLALLLLATWSGPVEGILYGFFIGFIQDVYSPENLGSNALTMALLAYLLDVVKERLTVEQYPVKAAVSIGACLLHDIAYLSLYTRFDGPLMTGMFFPESLLGAVYTTALFIGLIAVFQWIRDGGFFYVLEGLFRDR